MSDITLTADDISTIIRDVAQELQAEFRSGSLNKSEVPVGKKVSPEPALHTVKPGDNKRGSMPKGNMLKGEAGESDGASGVDTGPLLSTKGGTSKNGSGPTNTTGPLIPASMNKADGEPDFAADEESGPSPAAEDGADGVASVGAPAEDASADSSGSPMDGGESPNPAEGMDAGGAGPEGEPMGAPEETVETFYASLEDDDLRMHWEALKAVIVARSASGDGDADDIGAPQDGGADMSQAPEAAEASMSQPPMEDPTNPTMKSEDVDQGEVMTKSEADKLTHKLAKLEKSLDDKNKDYSKLAEDFKGLADLVKNTFTTPGQKAITAAPLAKSEPTVSQTLTRSEVKAKLDKVILNPTLTKSERNHITSFYLNGTNFEQIKHLLDEKK